MAAVLTSKQRAFLMAQASKEKAVIQIGKDGLTPEVTGAVEEALAARELVKIGVQKSCLEEPRDLAQALSERTRSALVQTIGRKIVLYKRAHEPSKRMELPK